MTTEDGYKMILYFSERCPKETLDKIKVLEDMRRETCEDYEKGKISKFEARVSVNILNTAIEVLYDKR